MAEVKDYACHRVGEPAAKKSKLLKREPNASKRCGCGFRIRAIVPIANYNEKDRTFVYQEEGKGVFKLYAMHSGHEPGPLDGNARIMHRVVGHKGGYHMDQETVWWSLYGPFVALPLVRCLSQVRQFGGPLVRCLAIICCLGSMCDPFVVLVSR